MKNVPIKTKPMLRVGVLLLARRVPVSATVLRPKGAKDQLGTFCLGRVAPMLPLKRVAGGDVTADIQPVRRNEVATGSAQIANGSAHLSQLAPHRRHHRHHRWHRLLVPHPCAQRRHGRRTCGRRREPEVPVCGLG